jgi:ABC-2 type transport system permease protein
MLRSVLTKTLWEQRRMLVGWVVGITAVGVLYAVFYPAIASPEYAEMMESFAPELMEALGFTAITTPAGYLGSTTFGILGPGLTIIFGAWLGIRAVAGDEESGRLDLLLAHPVSRARVAVERFGALIVAMLLAALVLLLALVVVSGPADLGSIGLGNLAAGSIHLAALGICFGGLALGVGAATGSRAVTAAVVAVVGVASYFGNTLAARIDLIAWARDVSPFHYYAGGRPLENGPQPIDLGVLLLAAGVFVMLGIVRFDRRDVAV